LYFVMIFLKGTHRIDRVQRRISAMRSLAIVVRSDGRRQQHTQ
jgi:hypothetical protein